jgi:hypothetical protein
MYNKILLILILSFSVSFAQAQTGTRSRSAISGKFVTKDYAKNNKSTTVTSKIKKSSAKRKPKN